MPPKSSSDKNPKNSAFSKKEKKKSAYSYLPDGYPLDYVRVAVADLDGILRGKMMAVEKYLSACEKGFGFCDVVFGWDSSDVAYDNLTYTGWHTGYPDAMVTLYPETARRIPWLDDCLMVLGDFEEPAPCPRRLLKNIAGEAEKMGFLPVFSQEFEWFNFRDPLCPFGNKFEQGFRVPESLTQGMFGYSMLRLAENSHFWTQLFKDLKAAGVPLEGLHTETGPGVAEAAIQHAPVVEAADRATLFKTFVKQIARQHSIMASFMAKWNENLPGCSGHVHQSLADGNNGKNLFFDAKKPNGLSDLAESYIAGVLHCLPHVLPMYAPNVNSYKRLVEGAWAPTTITWGFDNRTTALRVIVQGEKATRLEMRVAGSDANPYLAMAACLASGLFGIREKMKLKIAPTQGNGYMDERNGRLPSNLWEAVQIMKHSELAHQLFGKNFVEHFTATREAEWKRFMRPVTDWEIARYFEII
ncbi:MAG: glutamine synthetase family protein [Flavobacteriales bacterium]|nr:glutamine synthetase family protein [Flavobacteriales bacterium]MCX7650861.1 glutamine synthetase family protein [Flavobacteriales bacterium]MDW8432927.1 glutamine synthetase family protein [Flavobacteriales bacterium]